MPANPLSRIPIGAVLVFLAGALALSSSAWPQNSVREYPLPSGVGIHDVWADPAPDGPVWFSAQRSGQLGRLDPKSGKVELIDLGRGSSPHGVITAADGAPWLTDGGQNAIVRVDPKTREVKVWKLPANTGYANLNTATFDKAGIHWFTGQGGWYGRLDPRSGEMKLFEAPRGRGPYGITSTPDGRVYYASLAGSFIAQIDAASGASKLIEPPALRQGARRVWSDSKGNIWVSEWNSGQLSRFDPKTGSWSMWKAPGDSPQLYAVYVDETDRVWASEWRAQAMLRFDPATQKFEVFQSSSRSANVRQIHGRKGEVWTPESASGKIVVYRY
jgi:virginiamycin B lyase